MIKYIYILLITFLLFSCQNEPAKESNTNVTSDQESKMPKEVDVRTSGENHSINHKPVEEAIGGSIKSVSVQKLKTRIDRGSNDYVLMDVRTQPEFESGVIPTAKWFDLLATQTFKRKAKDLNKEQTYYLYCTDGARSSIAYAIMFEMGFKNIYDVSGGYLAWEKMVTEKN